TASNTASSEANVSNVLREVSRPIFSALAIKSSRYRSQLRDTDQFFLHEPACAWFKTAKRYEVDGSPEQLFERILQIKVSRECRRTFELDQNVNIALRLELVTGSGSEERQRLHTITLAYVRQVLG